jgi:hypothetical protein
MKTFYLILSVICGILFTVSIAGVGTIENLITFGILDVVFYLQYLNCKIDELNKKK